MKPKLADYLISISSLEQHNKKMLSEEKHKNARLIIEAVKRTEKPLLKTVTCKFLMAAFEVSRDDSSALWDEYERRNENERL